jgi:hypothetical protein
MKFVLNNSGAPAMMKPFGMMCPVFLSSLMTEANPVTAKDVNA